MISTAETRERFRKNHKRVDRFVEIFRALRPNSRRPSEAEGDILRSAVVFLHATVEDLLRSGEELRFLHAPAKAFERVRWTTAGTGVTSTRSSRAL